jgi:hypothetical protein
MPMIPTQSSSGYQGPTMVPVVRGRLLPQYPTDEWRSVPQVQHSTLGTGGGGGTLGFGFQASDPNIDYEMVGGLPSFQARHLYNQYMTRPPFRQGEAAWYPLRVPNVPGARPDMYLGHAVYSPVIPRRIPGQWQTTTQIAYGNQSWEYIGLRAPRLNEGAGLNAVGAQSAGAYGG